MKIFNNKQTKLQSSDNPKDMATYADLAKICLNTRPNPQQGFTPEEMKARLKVIDELEDVKADQEIQLEDADALVLQNCVATTKWLTLHKDILQFTEDIKNLKEATKQEKK